MKKWAPDGGREVRDDMGEEIEEVGWRREERQRKKDGERGKRGR